MCKHQILDLLQILIAVIYSQKLNAVVKLSVLYEKEGLL